MTQYLLSMYQPETGTPPPDVLKKIMQDVDAYIAETKAAGAWVFSRAPSADAATVLRFKDGDVLTTDGPFIEGKEHIGGFVIVNCRSGRRARVGQARAHPRAAADRNPAVPRTVSIAGVPMLDNSAIERVFREEYGRAVAVLVRHFGDIDVAEEAVQDAFTIALQRWRSAGLPPSPTGWIIATARNRAIDRLRREASRDVDTPRRCSCMHRANRRTRRIRRAPCATNDCV